METSISEYLGMYEFHDDAANSHKFYEVMRNHEPGRYVLRWGRIGTKGQEMGVDEHTALSKVREKLAKGYKLVRGEVKDTSRPEPKAKGKSKITDDVWDELDKKASGQ